MMGRQKFQVGDEVRIEIFGRVTQVRETGPKTVAYDVIDLQEADNKYYTTFLQNVREGDMFSMERVDKLTLDK